MATRPAPGAMASCVEIAQAGLPSARASPCIVARPIRTPVNEPGPRVTAKRSIDARSTAPSVNSQSMAGRSFSLRDDFPSIAIAPRSTPSRTSATERMGREASAARISIDSGLGIACRRDRPALSGSDPRQPDLDQLDADLSGDPDRAVVTIELAVIDAADAGIRDQLETVPAGRRRRVHLAAIDGHAVFRRLQNGVGFGVHGRNAMTIFHHTTGVFAVRQPAQR